MVSSGAAVTIFAEFIFPPMAMEAVDVKDDVERGVEAAAFERRTVRE